MSTLKPKPSWKVSFKCPHCEVPINVTMELGGIHSYMAALQANKGREKRMGQRKPESNVNRVGLTGKIRIGEDVRGNFQNARRVHHFREKGEALKNNVGRYQGKKF